MVVVVEFIDLIKTAETGFASLYSTSSHEPSVLSVDSSGVREGVNSAADLYRRNTIQKSNSLPHDGI